MSKRAAIYIRVSSEQQADQISPEAQERDCREHCKQKGYRLIEVYCDIEKYRVGRKLTEPSGTRADRPQFKRMIADADTCSFDVIVAWREDRLYRAFRPMLDILDCIERNNISIELTNDSFDPRFAPLKAWAAKLELEAKHERHIMGMAGRLEKGKAGNNPPLYGYAVVDDHYEIQPEEGKWVTQVWRWYAEGVKAREIRRRLIAAGAPQRRPTKYRWHKGIIQQMLAKESYYCGFTTFEIGRQKFNIPLPPLVDTETAKRVKARRESYKTYPAGNLKSPAVAAGKVYCAACEVKMRTVSVKSRGKVFYYYRCQNNLAGMSTPGCAGNISMHKLDAEIWGKVWKVLTEEGEFEAAIEARIAELQAQEIDAVAESERLRARLEELVTERQWVITARRKRQITDKDFDCQLAALSVEQSGIENELSKMQLLVGDRAARLKEVAERYREDTRRGMAGINESPLSAEHAQKQFEVRRKYVEGLVVQVDVQADKTPVVKMEINFSECLPINEAMGQTRWPRSRRARDVRCWPASGPRGWSER